MGTIWSIRRLGWSRNLKAYGADVCLDLSLVFSLNLHRCKECTYKKCPKRLWNAYGRQGRHCQSGNWKPLSRTRSERYYILVKEFKRKGIRKGTQMPFTYYISAKRILCPNRNLKWELGSTEGDDKQKHNKIFWHRDWHMSDCPLY